MHKKEELVRALVHEYQRTRHRLWSGALTLAFLPLLHKLRARVIGDALSADDLDQAFLAAFLAVASTLDTARVEGYTCAALRSQTWKRVLRHVRLEQRARDLFDSMDPNDILRILPADALDFAEPDERSAPRAAEWPETGRPPRPRVEPVPEVIDLLREIVGDKLARADLELVIATFLRGERLDAYVAARYPHASKPRLAKEYQRLKRARSRAVTRLKPILAHLRGPLERW
jgi:hypothetical protein